MNLKNALNLKQGGISIKGSRMGTWHFWCYMREVIEQYCGKDLYKKNGEWITNHFAALISEEDMRSCYYPSEDDIRLWLKREGFCKGE